MTDSGRIHSTARAKARVLIRGASVMTMDDGLGDFDGADVLICDGKVLAVEKEIAANDALVVDAAGKILMPGMVDGHRHLWQDLAKNFSFGNFMFETNVRYGPMYSAEDFYLANYIGGKTALDSGVTCVVDFCHLLQNHEQADAAARGTLASGVGGFFCPQFLPRARSYLDGYPTDAETAWAETMASADPEVVSVFARLRERHFPSNEGRLRFGVSLTGTEFAHRTREEIHREYEYAKRLEAGLVTQHLLGVSGGWRAGMDRSYRTVPDLYAAGLIGPGFLAAHGNGLSDDELSMIADAGGSVVSTVMGETGYAYPSVHARFRRAGGAAAIGADGTGRDTHDYFQHIRLAKYGLFRDEENIALAHALRPRDYLRLATIEGARALGLDSELGSITPGKKADLVLLRTDRPFFPQFGDLASRVFGYSSIEDVDSVWVGGECVKQDGSLVGFSWKEQFARSQTAWGRIEAAASKITFTGTMGPTFPARGN